MTLKQMASHNLLSFNFIWIHRWFSWLILFFKIVFQFLTIFCIWIKFLSKIHLCIFTCSHTIFLIIISLQTLCTYCHELGCLVRWRSNFILFTFKMRSSSICDYLIYKWFPSFTNWELFICVMWLRFSLWCLYLLCWLLCICEIVL